MPRFSDVHIRGALELIQKYGEVSRKQLTEELGVGEGSIRTILDKLKKEKLITSTRGGHSLTEKGKRALGKPSQFVRIDAGPLTVGNVDVATIVKGAAGMIRQGVEQRDAAIKIGADGATVLIFRGGKIQFPDGYSKIDGRVVDEFKRLGAREGDVIVIGTGEDAAKAEAGARAAASTIPKKA